MTGRVFIVTGASSGIGQEVARLLCEGGNDVILACRSEDRANRSIERIKKTNPSALATFMQLDLGDLASVRKFVEDFHATGKKLSVLINNAGVLLIQNKENKRQFTVNNFELTMGTNHLGHFLLTNLLLDDLKQCAASEGGDARIVVVASSYHDTELAKKRGPVTPLDVDDLFLAGEGAYSGIQAYKNSKLANVLFTYELARRLEGTGVKVNCLCPGFIPQTELMRQGSAPSKFFCRYVLHGMLRFTKMTRTVTQGAQAVCSLAVDDKYKEVNGKYIRDGAESQSSEESLDVEKQKKVWDLSARYTHLAGYEPLDAPPPPPEPEPVDKEQLQANSTEAAAAAAITSEQAPTIDEQPAASNKDEAVASNEAAVVEIANEAAGGDLVNGESQEEKIEAMVEKAPEKLVGKVEDGELNGLNEKEEEKTSDENSEEILKGKEVTKSLESNEVEKKEVTAE